MKAISTLGNLSLLNLSVNRAAQNRAFPTKKTLLIQNSNLSLNVQLMNKDGWDEEAIAERGKQLTKVATQLYPR
ncbi:GmrSD restriction endonuclease domain-containing protein [Luteimonas changyuni]|uniref:GmrSD restriction endonuclease domain-containing protein n=1 Tax=Luteimonas sp. MJ145 TaxID=3129234 RepID=UPI0031BAFE68